MSGHFHRAGIILTRGRVLRQLALFFGETDRRNARRVRTVSTKIEVRHGVSIFLAIFDVSKAQVLFLGVGNRLLLFSDSEHAVGLGRNLGSRIRLLLELEGLELAVIHV